MEEETLVPAEPVDEATPAVEPQVFSYVVADQASAPAEPPSNPYSPLAAG